MSPSTRTLTTPPPTAWASDTVSGGNAGAFRLTPALATAPASGPLALGRLRPLWRRGPPQCRSHRQFDSGEVGARAQQAVLVPDVVGRRVGAQDPALLEVPPGD
jgi:hypothetical protein